MQSGKTLYLDMETEKFDASGIAIDLYASLDEVPNRTSRYTEPTHQHNYYELFLILKGACQHIYRGSESTMIRGDIVLIPPGTPHAYRFQDTISLATLQFHNELMDAEWETLLHSMDYRTLQNRMRTGSRVESIDMLKNDESESIPPTHASDLNSQGIIRLRQSECSLIEDYMRQMLTEQTERRYGYTRMKRTLLEQIMVVIGRVQMRQFDNAGKTASWKEEMMEQVLSRIDDNPAEPFDFEQIAADWHITHTYFRRVFKNATGLAPVEYLGRTRVLRALELIQVTDIPVAEAAAQVGIYDANYFSRLFKKYLGYAPRYFKHIAAQ